MSHSALAQIVQNLEVILALPDGTGDYTHDLSGGQAVHMSPVWPPPVLPCVMVADMSMSSEVGNTLSDHTRTAVFQCVGWVGATTPAPLARFIQASNLLEDITRAVSLHRAQNDGDVMAYDMEGIVYDTRVTDIKVWPATDSESPSLGVCEFTIEVVYKNGAYA